MNKMIFNILIFIVMFGMYNVCFSNEIIEYDNDFYGLIIRESTLSDAISVLGSPIKVSQVNKTVRYRFEGIDISVYSDTGLINSIIIYDEHYIDKNGISVGNTFNSVKKLPEIKIVNSTIFDSKNGIVYWFDKNRITRIVLIGRAKNIK